MAQNRRINLDYGQGGNTPVFCLREKKFYLYGSRNDREMLHSRYGGKQYYESQSGMSGAGYLEPDAAQDDIVIFGFYRTDAAGEQRLAKVATLPGWDKKPLFGYVPLNYRKGEIESRKPIVLSDGRCIAYLWTPDQVAPTIMNWDAIRKDAKRFQFPVVNPHTGDTSNEEFLLYKSFKDIKAGNPLRFFDLRAHRAPAEWPEYQETNSQLLGILGIVQIRTADGSIRWLHRHQLGYFDTVFDEDPRYIEGEIADGMIGNGSGFVWGRSGDQVQLLAEMPGGTLISEKVSVWEWFTQTPENWHRNLVDKFLKDHYAVEKLGRVGLSKLAKLMGITSPTDKPLVRLSKEVLLSLLYPTVWELTLSGSYLLHVQVKATTIEEAKSKILASPEYQEVSWCETGRKAFESLLMQAKEGEEMRSQKFSTSGKLVRVQPEPKHEESFELSDEELLGSDTIRRLTGSADDQVGDEELLG